MRLSGVDAGACAAVADILGEEYVSDEVASVALVDAAYDSAAVVSDDCGVDVLGDAAEGAALGDLSESG